MQVEGTGNIRFTRRDACSQCNRPDFARTISLRLHSGLTFVHHVIFQPNGLCCRCTFRHGSLQPLRKLEFYGAIC